MPRPDPSRPYYQPTRPAPFFLWSKFFSHWLRRRCWSRERTREARRMNHVAANRRHVTASPQNRSRRHDEATKEIARTMAAGGWTAHEIQQHLIKNGTPVTWATVRAWIDPEYRVRRDHISAEDKRRWRDRSGEHVKRRILELAALGLSDKAISVVVDLYHGRKISPAMIREYRRVDHERRSQETTR